MTGATNVYLTPLDHFVQRTLGFGGYVRYVDDFILLHPDPARLEAARERIVTSSSTRARSNSTRTGPRLAPRLDTDTRTPGPTASGAGSFFGLRRSRGRRRAWRLPWRFAHRLIERILRAGHPVAVALERSEPSGNVKRRELAYLLEPIAGSSLEES